MALHQSIVQPSLPATAITGLDVVALALLVHVWLLVAGLAVWNDDAQTGIAWIDRRVHMSPRLYGGLMLVAVLVVWLPFAFGQFPVGGDGTGQRGRSVLFVFTAGGLLVGAGCYFLGGVLTNLRPLLAVSRTASTDAAAVESGHVQVSGRVESLAESLEAPVTETETVCYQLSGTRTTFEDDRSSDPSTSGSRSSAATETTDWAQIRPSEPIASLAEGTEQLVDRREPFLVRDETGAVVVDPTDAQLRLERSASVVVPGDDPTPGPIAAALRETTGLERTDRDWVYHETTLEPGEEVTVLGVAGGDSESVSTPDVTAELPTISAGETATEFVLSPGCAQQVGRHFRGAILGCGLASVVALASGTWILGSLAGHW